MKIRIGDDVVVIKSETDKNGNEFVWGELYKEEVEENKMEKIYKGWEIAKMISEGKLADGGILQSYSSEYTVKTNALYKNGIEVGNSFLTAGERIWKIKQLKQPKQCSFQEAFAAYEEGKEIASVKTGKVYCCNKDDINSFEAEEIRGKWYINIR